MPTAARADLGARVPHTDAPPDDHTDAPPDDHTDAPPDDSADDSTDDSADDSAAVTVEALHGAGATTVFDQLTAAETTVGGDLVDEAERRRLGALADQPHATRPVGWHPLVAHVGDEPAGYAALRLSTGTAGPATGDAAPVPGPRAGVVLTALLLHLAALAEGAEVGGAERLEVWVRRVDDRLTDAAAAAGFHPARTLGILGRDLPTGEAVPAPPPGVTVRSSTSEDDAEVVRVLRGAYAGTADGGWDLETFRTRTAWDWFRADDLLVADDGDGRLLGLHWLKRRDATTGEVHNLAIHPDAQGRGLGPVLLHAGLDHLASTGCDEVLLWVDRANERAMRLYTREGFTTRWDDVAFARDIDRARESDDVAAPA